VTVASHIGDGQAVLHARNEEKDLENLARLRSARDSICRQISGVIVGQDAVVEQLLVCLFARGHCILEGVPGLAKTLLVRTLAQCLSLEFSRIQFTPDLMPSDITGTEVMYEDRASGERQFRFVRGPLFGNVLLADEINRTPPKTQAALLEAMQERQVSAGGKRHPLPDPFFVLATQNPIEQEGTYPLPEAQLDRFLLKVFVGYPGEDEERKIYRLTTGGPATDASAVLGGPEMLALQDIVRRIPVSEFVVGYVARLVRATRAGETGAPQFIRDWVRWGVGPRGGQSVIMAARARAALDGRPEVEMDDVRAVAPAVLRHRIVLNYVAESQGQTSDTVIARLIETIPVLDAPADVRSQVQKVLK
jgi:MoxR-like ATPase